MASPPITTQQDLAGIAVRASLLGCILGASLALACTQYASDPRLCLYIAFLAFFHIMEFWTTAQFNVKNANTSSFLLSSNGTAYWSAQAAGVAEYLLLGYVTPFLRSSYTSKVAFYVGLICIIIGQGIRSVAMAQAGQSFSHALAYTKKDGHVLVTGGIYSFSRHPSYFGFFFFGIGTQLMLCNPVSFIMFTGVLWRFFKERIR